MRSKGLWLRVQQRAKHERGLALVEFSFVAIILVLIVAGTVDYGLSWRGGVAVTEAARGGTRVGAAMAHNPRTDHEVLSTVKATLMSAGHFEDLDRVIIYQAANANGAPPASCTAPSPTGSNCIVVNRDQLDSLSPTNFSYAAGPPITGSGCMTSNHMSATASWCPAHRNNSMGSAHYLGVQITVRRQNLFPILGEEQLITRRSVMRLEPDPL